MAGRSVGKSKYRKVADELRDNILSGRYAPGEPFPSVKMLCTRFGVSHLTAVKVVETLKGMGLVRARNGVGTFVARNAKHIGLIVPTVRQAEIFPPIVREISRLCQGSGIGIDFADISCETSDNGRATVLETARRMAESDVSGIVFHPLDFGDGAEIVNHAVVKTFREADVPLVILDSDLDADVAGGAARPDFVGVDNREIGEMAGRHVLDAGARSVAFVAWSATSGRHRLLQRPRRRERAETVAPDRQALPRRRARHRRERRRPGDARLADAHDRAPAVRGDCADGVRDLALAHGESNHRAPAHHGRYVPRRPRFHACRPNAMIHVTGWPKKPLYKGGWWCVDLW